MFKLLVVASAAIYIVMYVFGNEARRPIVARSEPMDVGVIKAAYTPDEPVEAVQTPVSRISDAKAIQIALKAGAEARADKARSSLLGSSELATAVETSTEPAMEAPAYWYVTGTRVNLRAGPGTANSVVGSLKLGAVAEVLGDRRGWYQIRTADGAMSGWIHGKFLNEKRPG